MNSLIYNTVKEPSLNVVIKWSRKGKIMISDENALIEAIPNYEVIVLSFVSKQGKAILQFESADVATKFTNECENGSIMYKNTLRFHPSYCKLVEPKAKKENVQEIHNVDLKDVIQIPDNENMLMFSKDENQHLGNLNNFLKTQYNTIIFFPISPDNPLSLFLEHNQYGDEYAVHVICEESKWILTIAHENGINKYECGKECFIVKEKTRFCRNLLFSSSSSGTVVVATTKRKSPCTCNYQDFCHDRLLQSSTVSMPTQMENEHVYEVYDKIAGHFSSTRYSQWNGVVDFLHTLPNYSLVMDMGCGNGKYLTYSHESRRLYILGCDRSVELLRICSGNNKDVSLMDGLFLSYRSECFDSVISIAVIHHLSTNALRRRFVINLLRVLKTGGRGLIVAWAMEKDKSGLDTKSNRGYAKADVMVQWQLQKEYNKEKKDGEVYQRYYHMFHQGELEWLLTTFDCIEIEKSWYERENWFVSFRKKCNICFNKHKNHTDYEQSQG